MSNSEKGVFFALFFLLLVFLENDTAAASSVQQQIDSLKPGEELLLNDVVIKESLTLTKPIIIRANNVIIEQPLKIESNDVRIEGIHFQGEQGILMKNVKNISIFNASFASSEEGVYIVNSQNITLEQIELTGIPSDLAKRKHGITVLRSETILIDDAKLTGTLDSIYVEESKQVRILNSQLRDGRYGVHSMYSEDIIVESSNISEYTTGIMVMMSKNIMLKDNLVAHQQSVHGTALTIYDSKLATIQENELRENKTAIQLQKASDIDMLGNELVMNVIAISGMDVWDSVFSNNRLRMNVLTTASSIDGLILSQNAYDDYGGYDLDGDHIGDAPYIATSTFGQWVLKRPNYQYFLGSSSVQLLTTLDALLLLSSQNVLLDERPKLVNNASIEMDFRWPYFVVSLLILGLLITGWRKLL
ncbi:nitrous oxide reductase family maturation protein NosD [Solibacillus sp. R5-41]|uniref:right-handed parallel beta-helix repeat-containing protein n=1 Tax=Solibacillus sp. R5-41 TaxID=2048654 RepID=UPI0012FE6657|nr:NosD domain-containing protein [Solibacillus sp. R5-41]